MGLFFKANSLKTKVITTNTGLLKRSQKYTDNIIEVVEYKDILPIEEIDEQEIIGGQIYSDIEIYEEKDLPPELLESRNEENEYDKINNIEEQKELLETEKNPKEETDKFETLHPPNKVSQTENERQRETDHFEDEISHHLIRTLEKGYAFFLIKVSLSKIKRAISKRIPAQKEKEIIQDFLMDIGKAYYYNNDSMLLMINKMYRIDPSIFLHQFSYSLKKLFSELKEINDLGLKPEVRVFPENGKTAEMLLNGLLK